MIDVGQVVALGEVPKPAGDTIGVHVVPVVLGENIVGVNTVAE